MKLRIKVSLFVLILAIIIVISFQVISEGVLKEHYLHLEEEEGRESIQRINQAMSLELRHINGTARDWAVWDDTYDFVQTSNQSYVDKNLVNSTFTSLQLNYLLIVDSAGEVVLAGGFDLDEEEEMEIPEELTDHLLPGHPLLDRVTYPDGIAGVVRVDQEQVMVAAQPILRSSGEGPIRGTLIFGRIMDDAFMNGLMDATLLPLEVVDYQRSDLPTDYAEAKSNLESGANITFQRINESVICTYSCQDDVYGTPCLLIKTTLPREIFLEGQSVVGFLSIFVTTPAFAFILVALFVSFHFIISRLSTLSSELDALGKSGDISKRVEVTGNDEISRLSAATNSMLDNLQSLQKKTVESEDRYRAIVEDQTDLLHRFTSDGKITFMNEAMAKFFRLEGQDVVGQDVTKMLGGGVFSVLQEQLRSLSPSNPVATSESMFTTQDGEVRWLQWTVRCIMDPQQHIVEYQAVGRDITERKDAELALEQTNKKLNLLSTITRHDILNQIMAVSGFLQLLELSTKEEKSLDHLKKMGKAMERLKQQIEFTRQYQNMGVNKPQWLQASASFAKASSNLKVRDTTLSISLDGLELFADPLLEKVFYNLMENSLRHGGLVTSIKIFYEEQANGLVVVYQDNGVGVPEEEKQKIFEPGFGRNTGYGLFLVQEILGITGMTVREVGSVGKGARFEIYVPRGKYHLAKRRS